MCGLAGFIGNYLAGFVGSDMDAFEHNLTLNAFRGSDSTGVVAVTNKNEILHTKVLGYPQGILNTPVWNNDVRPLMVREGRFIIGHGRKATVGTVSIENAHPFHVVKKNAEDEVISDITLIHNGTLESYSNEGIHKHAVDSLYLADEIAEKGATEALSSIHGAIATMWYDKLDKSLNIFRNSERPLFWMEDISNGNIYINSEPSVLLYLMFRFGIKKASKVQPFRTQVHYRVPLEPPTKKPIQYWSETTVEVPKKVYGVRRGEWASRFRGGGGWPHEVGPTNNRPILVVEPDDDDEWLGHSYAGIRPATTEIVNLKDKQPGNALIDMDKDTHQYQKERIYSLARRICDGELAGVQWIHGNEIWEYPDKTKPAMSFGAVAPMQGLVALDRVDHKQVRIHMHRNSTNSFAYLTPPGTKYMLEQVQKQMQEAGQKLTETSRKSAAEIPVLTKMTASNAASIPPTKSELKEMAKKFAIETTPRPGRVCQWHSKVWRRQSEDKVQQVVLRNYALSKIQTPFLFDIYGNELDGFFVNGSRVGLMVMRLGDLNKPSALADTVYTCTLISPAESHYIKFLLYGMKGAFKPGDEITAEVVNIRAATKEEHTKDHSGVVMQVRHPELFPGDKEVGDRILAFPKTMRSVAEARKFLAL